MLDLSDEPVVDAHCHAFLPLKETEAFERYLSLSMVEVPKADMVNTVLYRRVIRELSRVLGIAGKGDDIVAARNEAYRRDPEGYIRRLFEDVNLDTLLIDTGYPSEYFTGYSVRVEDFKKLVRNRIHPIFRIDNTVFRCLSEAKSFEEASEALAREIDNAVEKEGAVGLKTIVAYLTGLEIRRVSDRDAGDAYNLLVSKVKGGASAGDVVTERTREAKTALDWFVFLSAKKCAELEVPLQIHTGIGDAPLLNLRLAEPTLLYHLIGDEELKRCKFVLVHAGYPFAEEVGFLVNTYPNVYVDLSEMTAFTSIGVKDKILRLLEMAPTNKIMYGSDGYNIPELFWIAAVETKKALSEGLSTLVESYSIDQEWARQVAQQVLHDNAVRIYRLGGTGHGR
jgi:predicted TIM-barrel fold metal-dependent hydrolase